MPPVDVGPFRLERVLGRGGTSEVWAATHARARLDVALKVQTAPGRGSARAAEVRPDRDAFAAEVRAVARLDHPSIVLVLDQGVVDPAAAAASHGALPVGTPWLAMERCSGGTLRDHPPADWDAARALLVVLLDALASAHARGVLHRDIKPDNVLLATEADLRPGWKLTDFGLALAREVDRAGVVLGTPAFMAPEQFAQDWRAYGPWTDLYALGALAWWMLTGAAPFGEGREPAVLALAHQELPPPAFAPRFPVPDGVEELLRGLLAKAPTDRPSLAADVRGALDDLAGTRDDAGRFPADWRRTVAARRPRLWGVGLGLYPFRTVPMVGRDRERDRLWRALGDVYRGGVAKLVVVQGGLGSGKSRLAGWLAERAEEVGAGTVVKVDHAEAGEAGLPVALARRLGCEGLAPEPLEGHLEAWLRRRGVSDAWEWRSLRTLLAPPDAVPAGQPASGDATFLAPDQRFAVTRRLLERLAARRPVVLWIEDAHLAADSLAFVQALLDAQQATPSAILVVVTARTESLAERPVEGEQIGALVARDDAEVVELGALAPPHQVQLVEGLLGLSGELSERVRARSAGNPGFAVQLVGDWVQRGVLDPTAEGWVLRAGAKAELPDDLHAFWSARVERVLAGFADPRQARAALEIAALRGPQAFGPEVVAACACAGIVPPAELVDRLAHEHLARPGPDGTWLFAHNMVRESLARGAVEGGRAPGWHAACAHAIALHPDVATLNEELATHLAGAGDLDAAADFQLLAARERAARGEDRLALALLEDRDDGLQAAGVPPHDVRWGEGQVLQARLYARQGQWERAVSPAQATLLAARRHGWTELEASALTIRGEVARAQGDTALALRHLTDARVLAERTGDRREQAQALRSLGVLAAAAGDLARAGRLLVQAQQAFAAIPDDRAAADVLVARADVARRAGEQDRVPRLLQEARDAFERSGNRVSLAELERVRGDLLRVRGDLAAATDAYRASLALYESVGSSRVLGPLAGLGLVLTQQGRGDDARSVLDLGLSLAAGQGSAQWLGPLLAGRLDAAALVGDEEAVVRTLDDLGDWARRTGGAHPDVAEVVERAAARLASAGDDVGAARAQAIARGQREVLARAAVG